MGSGAPVIFTRGPMVRARSLRKILCKFGGLEAILAIRNIKIDMKLKVAKSKNIMNKCHNEYY